MRIFRPVRGGSVLVTLSLVVAVVVGAGAVVMLTRPSPRVPQAQATSSPEPSPAFPSPTPTPSPTASAEPTPTPSITPSSPTPSPEPAPRKKKVVRPRLVPFRGLGAWVDLWDYGDLDPAATVADLKRHGVRTMYVQTGRFNTEDAVSPEVGPWLVAAHGAGMDVVGWYLPAYKHMKRDVRRGVAVGTYRYQGHAFDGVGIDIEWKNDVPNPEWNDRVVEHLQQVRAAVRRRVAVAAIVPPPLQMEVAPVRWAGFPWRGIARHSDVIMLMSYWSYRDCENIPDHCAYPFTSKNLEETRRLIGDAGMPIHSIGGVGDRITRDEVEDFVRGAQDGRAYGASLYDVRTTSEDFWPVLARLRSL